METNETLQEEWQYVNKARKSNGDIISVGDKVKTNFHKKCEGQEFIVEQITVYTDRCKTGFVVLVHLVNDVERKIRGLQKEGWHWPIGIDADWFEKIT